MEALLEGTQWASVLRQEFTQEYFKELCQFLKDEKKRFEVFPPDELVFAALQLCNFEDVKVVILGQDPYVLKHQANGLAFSVSKDHHRVPPSLRNIFDEVRNDLGADGISFSVPKNGCLDGWAKQGVLLLNTCLTVR